MGGSRERAATILSGAIRHTYHEQDGRMILNTYQDVEPHLEHAARMRRAEAERGRFAKKGDFRPRMTAPFNVLLGIAKKLGIPAAKVFDPDCNARIWKELNSADYKKFRLTNDKRIG